jgi:cytochrome c oxidase subunit 2
MSEPRQEPVPETRHEPGGDAPPASDAPSQETLHVDRFEAAWMRIAAAVLAIFFISILVSAFASGFQVPGVYQRIDPTKLYEPGSPFADPGLRELAPGKYEAYIRAQIWSFTPNEIRIPAGSEVTFYTTSQDVQHGIKIQGTNINMMILPGQVSTLKAKFDTPGTYDFVCHEYCGQLHHTMYGQLIVEAEQVAAQ